MPLNAENKVKLLSAIEEKQWQGICLILDADPSLTNEPLDVDGRTIVAIAAFHDQKDLVVRLIVKYKADIFKIDKNGRDTLAWASGECRDEIHLRIADRLQIARKIAKDNLEKKENEAETQQKLTVIKNCFCSLWENFRELREYLDLETLAEFIISGDHSNKLIKDLIFKKHLEERRHDFHSLADDAFLIPPELEEKRKQNSVSDLIYDGEDHIMHYDEKGDENVNVRFRQQFEILLEKIEKTGKDLLPAEEKTEANAMTKVNKTVINGLDLKNYFALRLQTSRFYVNNKDYFEQIYLFMKKKNIPHAKKVFAFKRLTYVMSGCPTGMGQDLYRLYLEVYNDDSIYRWAFDFRFNILEEFAGILAKRGRLEQRDPHVRNKLSVHAATKQFGVFYEMEDGYGYINRNDLDEFDAYRKKRYNSSALFENFVTRFIDYIKTVRKKCGLTDERLAQVSVHESKIYYLKKALEHLSAQEKTKRGESVQLGEILAITVAIEESDKENFLKNLGDNLKEKGLSEKCIEALSNKQFPEEKATKAQLESFELDLEWFEEISRSFTVTENSTIKQAAIHVRERIRLFLAFNFDVDEDDLPDKAIDFFDPVTLKFNAGPVRGLLLSLFYNRGQKHKFIFQAEDWKKQDYSAHVTFYYFMADNHKFIPELSWVTLDGKLILFEEYLTLIVNNHEWDKHDEDFKRSVENTITDLGVQCQTTSDTFLHRLVREQNTKLIEKFFVKCDWFLENIQNETPFSLAYNGWLNGRTKVFEFLIGIDFWSQTTVINRIKLHLWLTLGAKAWLPSVYCPAITKDRKIDPKFIVDECFKNNAEALAVLLDEEVLGKLDQENFVCIFLELFSRQLWPHAVTFLNKYFSDPQKKLEIDFFWLIMAKISQTRQLTKEYSELMSGVLELGIRSGINHERPYPETGDVILHFLIKCLNINEIKPIPPDKLNLFAKNKNNETPFDLIIADYKNNERMVYYYVMALGTKLLFESRKKMYNALKNADLNEEARQLFRWDPNEDEEMLGASEPKSMPKPQFQQDRREEIQGERRPTLRF